MAERPTDFDVAVQSDYRVITVVSDVPRARVGRVVAGIMRGDGIDPFDGELIEVYPAPAKRRSGHHGPSWGPDWDHLRYEREKGHWRAHHVGEFVVDIAKDVQKHKKRGVG